jgi:hypothetical protein
MGWLITSAVPYSQAILIMPEPVSSKTRLSRVFTLGIIVMKKNSSRSKGLK